MEGVVTITFGDCAENHVGMQKIGKGVSEGFSFNELKQMKKKFGKGGKIYHLNQLLPPEVEAEDAYILVIRNGLNKILGKNDLFEDLLDQEWDTKAKMRGKVVNKHARYNLCFGDISQEPDYKNGKGRIINFEEIENLNRLREALPKYCGPKASNLVDEGNYYYDRDKKFTLRVEFIVYHGDTERRIVIAIRLGEDFNISYQWYRNSSPIGQEGYICLSHEDLYIMSDKAVGYDWKKRSQITLRLL